MDEHDDYSIDENKVTNELLGFMLSNMTAAEVKGLAFEIGYSPDDLAGSLAEELARSLIGQAAQRADLVQLDRALRDLYPADYSRWFHNDLDAG